MEQKKITQNRPVFTLFPKAENGPAAEKVLYS
jgi:hypothetical protein